MATVVFFVGLKYCTTQNGKMVSLNLIMMPTSPSSLGQCSSTSVLGTGAWQRRGVWLERFASCFCTPCTQICFVASWQWLWGRTGCKYVSGTGRTLQRASLSKTVRRREKFDNLEKQFQSIIEIFGWDCVCRLFRGPISANITNNKS